MILYADGKQFHGTPEEIFKIIDLMERSKKEKETIVNIKISPITSPFTVPYVSPYGSPYIYDTVNTNPMKFNEITHHGYECKCQSCK